MIHFLAGIVLSLFPERYRKKEFPPESGELRAVTIISALLQMLACLGIFIWRYFAFLRFRVQDLGERMLDAGQDTVLANPELQMGMGFVSLLEYILLPLSFLLIYFFFEGAVRFFSAAFTGETLATLPLATIGWTHNYLEEQQERRRYGEKVSDLVEEGDGTEFDLRISSCRAKPKWGRTMIVFYQSKYYQVWKQVEGKPPRPFVYLLKKKPPEAEVTYFHKYDPDEVFQQK